MKANVIDCRKSGVNVINLVDFPPQVSSEHLETSTYAQPEVIMSGTTLVTSEESTE